MIALQEDDRPAEAVLAGDVFRHDRSRCHAGCRSERDASHVSRPNPTSNMKKLIAAPVIQIGQSSPGGRRRD